jgi:hypothetical protein
MFIAEKLQQAPKKPDLEGTGLLEGKGKDYPKMP